MASVQILVTLEGFRITGMPLWLEMVEHNQRASPCVSVGVFQELGGDFQWQMKRMGDIMRVSIWIQGMNTLTHLHGRY